MKIITFISVILLGNFVIRNPAKAHDAEHYIQKRGIDFEKIWGDIKSVFPKGDKCIKAKDVENVMKRVIQKFLDKVMETFDEEDALSDARKAKEKFIALAEQYFRPERVIKEIEEKKTMFMDIADKLLNSNAIVRELMRKKS